jgi:ABC-2 type transport system permease protein
VKALLQAELLKLRTTITFAALAGTALGLSLLLVVLTTALSDFKARDVRDLFAFSLVGIFILLLGVMGMAGEWRHKTITSSVLAAPDRLKLIAAKTLSYAVAGAVLSLVVNAIAVLIGTLILSARGQPTIDMTHLIDIMWRKLSVAAYLGAIGVCIGAIVRNQVAAIIGSLVVFFVVEGTLLQFVPSVGKFAPLTAAPNGLVHAGISGHSHDLLAPGIAALVMVGWLSVLFAIGAGLLRGRDLT